MKPLTSTYLSIVCLGVKKICKTLIPYCSPTLPLWGHDLKKLEFALLNWGCLRIDTNHGRVVLEMLIFTLFSKYSYLKLNPHSNPIISTWAMIWTIQNLLYIRKVSHTTQVVGFIFPSLVVLEMIMNWTLYFPFLLLSSLGRWYDPSVEQHLTPFTLGRCSKFGWNWQWL